MKNLLINTLFFSSILYMPSVCLGKELPLKECPLLNLEGSSQTNFTFIQRKFVKGLRIPIKSEGEIQKQDGTLLIKTTSPHHSELIIKADEVLLRFFNDSNEIKEKNLTSDRILELTALVLNLSSSKDSKPALASLEENFNLHCKALVANEFILEATPRSKKYLEILNSFSLKGIAHPTYIEIQDRDEGRIELFLKAKEN